MIIHILQAKRILLHKRVHHCVSECSLLLCMLVCLCLPVCIIMSPVFLQTYMKNEWVHPTEFWGLFHVWRSITLILCFYQCSCYMPMYIWYKYILCACLLHCKCIVIMRVDGRKSLLHPISSNWSWTDECLTCFLASWLGLELSKLGNCHGIN